MLIACGAGILVGALVGGLAVLRNLLLPVFSSLYAVPIVILYPIFTAWFGIGSESKIAFAGIYGFFPVMLSTAAGIRTIDQQLPARRPQHGRHPAAADHARHHPGLDPDRAGRPAARRRARHHRRRRVGDADLGGRHRLSCDAHTAPCSTARACSPAILMILVCRSCSIASRARSSGARWSGRAPAACDNDGRPAPVTAATPVAA